MFDDVLRDSNEISALVKKVLNTMFETRTMYWDLYRGKVYSGGRSEEQIHKINSNYKNIFIL